jgi:two-component system, NtrC family, response regulator AtoC
MANTAKLINGQSGLAVNGLRPELPPQIIFGYSEAMREVQSKIDKMCDASVPVLIQGESGTGKEVIARLLHQKSPRKASPFVKVNCPAIPGTLLESELFGYERGAFTGANNTKPGRVELANGGTLFLDEIAELDAGLQSKLLQLLQDGQFYSIGGKAEKSVDVRVICATNGNLQLSIESGAFRRDLFYRINVVNITLPPLRDRQTDIPVLVNFLLRTYAELYGRKLTNLSGRTLAMLEQHSWPGNIRQLENLIKRYVILGSEEAILSELVHPNGTNGNGEHKGNGGSSVVPFPVAVNSLEPGPTGATTSLRKMTQDAMQDFEGKVILQTLREHRWNRKRAARALNISYRALLYKMKRSGIGSNRLPEEPARTGE